MCYLSQFDTDLLFVVLLLALFLRSAPTSPLCCRGLFPTHTATRHSSSRAAVCCSPSATSSQSTEPICHSFSKTSICWQLHRRRPSRCNRAKWLYRALPACAFDAAMNALLAERGMLPPPPSLSRTLQETVSLSLPPRRARKQSEAAAVLAAAVDATLRLRRQRPWQLMLLLKRL